MAKNKLLNSILWLVGALTVLAVAFGMVGKVLTVPIIPELVTVVVGWIIVALVVLTAIMAIIKKLK